jgi:hypothetical protein
MKKLLMTSEEYYNRKKIDDYMDEELTSHEGCRNLAVFLMIFFALMFLAILFLA